MFNKLKTYFHILLFVIPFTVCSLVFSSRSYGLEATALGSALWSSYNLASEYYVARAGRNILGTHQISTDINGVSGITDGTYSESYGEVVSSAASGSPINITNLLSLAKEVDTSNMSLSELNALSVKIANAPWNTDGSIVMKNIAFGGISLYFAVDSAGNWLGSTYDNIVAKFSDMTVSRATSIQDKASLRYPNVSINSGYVNSMSFDGTGSAVNSNGSIMLISPVYFYGRYNNNHYNMAVLFDSDIDITSLFVYGGYSIYDSVHDVYNTYPIHSMDFVRRGTTSINGHSYYYGDINFSFINANGNLVTGIYPYLPREFHSLQSGIEFYTNRINSSNVGFESDIIDSSGVPYLVDDLGDYATTIGDLYPVIEKLREVISTIPSVDELSSVISDQVKSLISDLIDGIKAEGLTLNGVIDDAITDTDTIADVYYQGIEVPPDLPTGLLDNFSNVIKLPFKFFSIFSPIFQIFGASSAVFALWLFLPSFFIIMLIIWALK